MKKIFLLLVLMASNTVLAQKSKDSEESESSKYELYTLIDNVKIPIKLNSSRNRVEALINGKVTSYPICGHSTDAASVLAPHACPVSKPELTWTLVKMDPQEASLHNGVISFSSGQIKLGECFNDLKKLKATCSDGED